MMFEPRCLSAVRLGPHRFPDDFVDDGKRFHGASAGLASAGAVTSTGPPAGLKVAFPAPLWSP
jgi:hypothetical protein